MLTAILFFAAALGLCGWAGWWYVWYLERIEHRYWRGMAHHWRVEARAARRVADSLAARVAVQSELLGKKAERKEVEP